MVLFSLVTFLRWLGLEPIFDLKQETDIRNKRAKVVANWLYPLFIWIVLWYHPILITIVAFTNNHPTILPRACFSFIPPIQYYVSFWYFRSQRTKRIYESKDYDFLDNKEGKGKYFPEENTLLKLVISVAIIFMIEAFAIFFLTIEEADSYYNELNKVVQGIGYFMIPLSIVYGKFVLTLSIHVFVFSFFQQIQKMRRLREKLEKRSWKEGQQIAVATLCYEICDIRYTLSRMISKLEDMYTYTTVLGSVGIGLLLTIGDLDFHTITGTIIFCLMQVFFLFIIQSVGKERDRFRKIIYHRKFASTYILRRNEFCQACLQIQKESNEKDLFYNVPLDIQRLSENMTKPTGDLRPLPKSIKDKQIIQKNIRSILTSESESQDMSIEVHRIEKTSLDNPDAPVEIIEESADSYDDSLGSNSMLTDSSVRFQKRTFGDPNEEKTISESSLRDADNSTDESEDIRQHIKKLLESGGIGDPHVLADSGCSLTTEEIIRCIYEWVTNTGSTVDWIVLNSILNENWSSFGMFGIEFSNGSALRKAIYITIILVGTASVLGIAESTW